MVKAVFDNLAADKPKTISPSASTTTFPTRAWRMIRISPRNPIKSFAPCSTASARTARWARTKIPSRSSARKRRIYAQGYFVYDSKKSGSMTVSHLRFGPEPIRSTYLVSKANFVACHQPMFLPRFDMVKPLVPGGTFLLNTPYSKDEIWSNLPTPTQEVLIAKKAKLYVIDATKVARDSGMGGRINTIMQVCFFALSGVLPRDEAIDADQVFHQENLRQERRGSRGHEPQGRGQHAGASARSAGAGPHEWHRPRWHRRSRSTRRGLRRKFWAGSPLAKATICR